MKLAELLGYKAIAFDCDGVLLDSNHVKTNAFYEAAKSYGENAARMLVHYHIQNGGVSRYSKFKYFQESILSGVVDPQMLQTLLNRFGEEVRQGLLSCAVAGDLERLRNATSGIPWFVVSGGDQGELRDVFAQRGIESMFDGGIFGSPEDKDTILKKQIQAGRMTRPAVFFGDARYDMLAAERNGLDFVLVRNWSENLAWVSELPESSRVIERLGDIQ